MEKEAAYQEKVDWLNNFGPEEKDEEPEEENTSDASTSTWKSSIGANNSDYCIVTQLTEQLDFYASTAEILRPRKKAKTSHLSSITIGYIASRKDSRQTVDW